MQRIRSHYLLSAAPSPGARSGAGGDGVLREVRPQDRVQLARLLLDAYRGTIDDEGEGDEEALDAIDMYFSRILWPHSVVLEEGATLTAMSFVVVVDEIHYIDPVATAASSKRAGRGRAVVLASLESLRTAGVSEVGAVITDGNTSSERLFTSLGFVRTHRWS